MRCQPIANERARGGRSGPGVRGRSAAPRDDPIWRGEGNSGSTRAVIRNVECRAGAGLEAALPRNPGGVLSMSELPSGVPREGRGLGASEGSQIRVSGLPRDLRFVCRGFGRSPRVPPPCSSHARVSPRWARASSRCRSRVLAPASLGREGPCGGRLAPAYLALGRAFRVVSREGRIVRQRPYPAPSRRLASVSDAVGPPQMQQATPASSAGESPPCLPPRHPLPPCLPRVARGTRPTTTSRTSWRANDQICTA